MAKITRSRLARGAKLLTDHIFAPLQSAQAQLTGADVVQEQMEAGHAPFRLNWSVPHWGSHFSNGTKRGDGAGYMLCIPFMLPPLQDSLSYTEDGRGNKAINVSKDTPALILDEVSVSFDQRGEPAAILSNWAEGPAAQGISADKGKLSYERSGNLDLEFAIMEKSPTWKDPPSGVPNLAPSRVVWSGTLGAHNLQGGYLRLNPWVASHIREEIDPFKSYVFVISAPRLEDTKGCELVSLEISLRFLTPLIARDEGGTIQNIPYRHRGAQNVNLTHTGTGAGKRSSTARPLITAVPAAGDLIEANTASGVQTSMSVIDEFMRRKLQGGYTMDSDVPMLEELTHSGAYTVLAVPLFNNTRYGGVGAATYFEPTGTPGAGGYRPMEPYVNTPSGCLIDRRYIPIVAPMTIHHILYSWNWFQFVYPTGGVGVQTANKTPSGGDQLELQLGVGIGTGVRADTYNYEEVAYGTINTPCGGSAGAPTAMPASWYADAVDLWSLGRPGDMPQMGATAFPKPFNLELHCMDVGGTGSPGLNGMTAQGRPFFVGKSTSPTASRVAVQATGVLPVTAGAEQWIEVRARILAAAGSPVNMGAFGAGSSAATILSGAGGMWVYIIGKTHLV